ncbi:plasmolipin [Pelobates fuscus]|uniref:plasmolipin n=1 Tax=Pelobates fuscus TaxID=191477 RepID=UPI002FE4DC30
MAEFPSKVSTQTSTPEASGSNGIMGFLNPDLAFLRSIPGILMLVEICLGLLMWALVADSPHFSIPPYEYVLFVGVFCWLVTLILYVMLILQLQRKMTFIPWNLVLFIYNVAALLLYITGFFTCAASVDPWSYKGTSPYNKRAAASFFGCLVMISYGASAFFSFMEWRGSPANAASAQA